MPALYGKVILTSQEYSHSRPGVFGSLNPANTFCDVTTAAMAVNMIELRSMLARRSSSLGYTEVFLELLLNCSSAER
jgi:hypothetical protein